MKTPREIVTEWFINKIDELKPGNKNVAMYKAYFAGLSDDEFEILMDEEVSDIKTLPYYAPNLAEKDVDIENALKVADELGLNLFQRVWMVDPVSGVKFLSTVKYFIVTTQLRRQAQHVSHGKTVAEDSVHTDILTGQAIGPSDTTHLSLPEIMNLEAVGLHSSIEEMLNIRGGNQRGFIEAKQRLINNGQYSLNAIKDLGYRPTSIETMHSFLLGMHFDNNI